MNFKKIILSILVLGAVIGTVSCGKEKNEKQIIQIDSEESYFKDIVVEDYEGYNFRMLTRKGTAGEQYQDEQTGNIIDDAVFKRNEIVKNLLNIELSITETSTGNAETEAMSSILAGDDSYDIIFTHSRSAFQYAVQNTLINYNDVETLNLDKPWWHSDIVDSCNVNGRLYVLDGDIQTSGLGYAMCLYFNKTLFDELGLEYPYQAVNNGTWTFDELVKLSKKGSKDLNGDGVIIPTDDRFGFVTTDWGAPISFLYSSGQRIYSKDAKGIPVLSLNTSKTVDLFNEFFDFMDSEEALILTQEAATGYCVKYSGANIFQDGRAMFYHSSLRQAQGMRAMNDDFGIVPIPKFTADDEYATVVNGHSSLVVMPITVEDENRTGNIMETLCIVGSKEVIPAFYDVSLKTKFARDTESEEMIDKIKSAIIYDLGYVAGGPFDSIGYNLAHSGGEFSSTYAANESSALQKLKEFNKAYGKIG